MTPSAAPDLRIAYLVSRFPEYSEGFIRYELREVGRLVGKLAVLPLVASPLQGAAALLDEAGLTSNQVERPPGLFSPALVGAVLRSFAHNPRGFLRAAGAAFGACLDSPRHGLKWLLLFPRMLWLGGQAAKRGTDHIHAHFAALPANAAWTIHKIFGIPYSVTAHAYDLHTSPRLLRRSLSDAAFGVIVSEHTARLARKLVPERPDFSWHIVRNGVPLDLFPPPQPRPPQSRPLILAVGRLLPQKGLSDLLEACRILRNEGCEFSCLIVGDGPLAAELRRQVSSSGLEGCVTFSGVLTGDELRRVYAGADFFALPCVTLPGGGGDTLPVVLTEAAARGLPLVSTPVAAIAEFIEDGLDGRLVPEHDPSALAAALRGLLDNVELRSKLAVNARRKVEIFYDAAASARRLVSLFAAGGGAASP